MTTLREAYDLIDRFLRNNLYDDDYAEYSEALELLSSEPPQRKPLTEEEILKAWKPFEGNPFTTKYEFARAIEKAHGIGGEE